MEVGESQPTYPKDEPGKEMRECARVWRIYMDEATKADLLLTEGCNRDIDALLVFTGLFSAVLATFIIQSYQLMLSAAEPAPTNTLLEQIIDLQANSTKTQPPPTPSISSPSLGQMQWVNGLWFAALSCSLSTALISILAKEWLRAYVPNISGTPHHRARQRQHRYMQLEAWHVLALVNALPLLLHVALLLFFTGLIVLLWSIDLAITFATWTIVALAYTLYFASIWLPFIYDDCPYRHPISEHLRHWISSYKSSLRQSPPADCPRPCDGPDIRATNNTKRCAIATHEHKLDAAVLVWLFTKSMDNDIITAALQAIAGLPLGFSAIQVLRDAGALYMVERAFQSCFELDTTVELKWHLTNPDGAWSYCRAWINLTRGTTQQWPMELLDPLWKLQQLKSHPDAAAIASCAVARSSLHAAVPQWELLTYLDNYVAGEVQLAHSTVCLLLDTVTESLVQWEMPIAVIEMTTIRAVSILLRLLHVVTDLPVSAIRSAAALALYICTCGPADSHLYQSEEQRRASYCEIMLRALSTIITDSARFEVKGSFIDITAQELSKLASPINAQPTRFSPALQDAATSSLCKLFMDGRIGIGIVPDAVLANVLQLLHKNRLSPAQQPLFVKTIVDTLLKTSHPDIASWSLRILKPLLSGHCITVLEAFTESNGINAVLRAAGAGDIDNRRLHLDSWRTACAFLDGSILLYLRHQHSETALSVPARKQFEAIFQSDFFETLCSATMTPRWWLFELSAVLVRLCRLRPSAAAWRTVINVLRNASERDTGQESDSELLCQLSAIVESSGKKEASGNTHR